MNGQRGVRQPECLAGVVLAGGQSRRLGRDKTRLCLHGESSLDMLNRTCSLLDAVVDEVWISCRTRPVTASERPWFADERPGIGPIGGIATALRTLRRAVLALSCDLPFMDETVLAALVDQWRSRSAGTVMTTFVDGESGRIEPLVAIYDCAALPLFDQAIHEEQFRLGAVVPLSAQLRVPYPAAGARAFFNVNTPAELEQVRRMGDRP